MTSEELEEQRLEKAKPRIIGAIKELARAKGLPAPSDKAFKFHKVHNIYEPMAIEIEESPWVENHLLITTFLSCWDDQGPGLDNQLEAEFEKSLEKYKPGH